MIEFNKEYFESPYYFFLKEGKDMFSLYYSVSDTISESRKDNKVIKFDKSQKEEIKKTILKILKSGKKLSKERISMILNSKQKNSKKQNGEIDELVNADGSYISSNIPILNQRVLAKKTTDQTAKMTKSNQFPYIRGYWNEGTKEDKPVIDEEDMSGAFAKEETENDRTYNECMESMEELGVEEYLERDERCKVFGFDPKLDRQLEIEKEHGECKNCFTKKRLAELEKQKMNNMLDEILLSKKNNNKDVVKKTKEETEDNSPISKILMRNIESIKKIAEKEGISLNKLIKHLSKGE